MAVVGQEEEDLGGGRGLSVQSVFESGIIGVGGGHRYGGGRGG